MDRLAPWLIPLVLAGCASEAAAPVMPAGFGGAAAPAPTAAPVATPAAATPSNTPRATPTITPTPGTGAMAAPGPGAAPTEPAAPGGPAAADPAATDPAAPGAMDPACRGIPIEGLVYSPGGTELPNKCMPFHATTNNPYAVRCIDAWPWYKTGFPGDEFCILPPPPDKGIQYGVHPQGKMWFEQVSKGDLSGYEGLSDEWLMEDGDEEQMNYQTSTTNTAEQNYYRTYARMRRGSHHMIVSSMELSDQETWGSASTGLTSLQLPGAQRPDENQPKSLEKPDEDKGLYRRLPAMAPVSFNMHHFNAAGEPIMKEAWTNLWWESDATIELRDILGLEFSQTAGLAVEPGQTVDLHYSWDISSAFRIVNIFGHRHAWTTNFSVWVEKPDGVNEIIYQSWYWLDEPTYRYDSQTMNPTPEPEKRLDAAHSGILMTVPGTKLHFNCHIEYTDARAASEKSPVTPAENGTLRFANEAFTAEMCIMFGQTTGAMLIGPSIDSSPLPAFTK
jgi:hypothetical protein